MIENLNGIHETVKYKENSNVKLFINVEVEDYPIHWHTPMEIIMPLEGSYTVQIGDDLVHLNESDIIFIASGVKHRLIAPDTGKRLILQIEWSAVSKIKELNSILTLISSPSLPMPLWRELHFMAASTGEGILYSNVLT